MGNNALAQISVVIPTIGRDSVFTALKSVFSQSYKINEVLVCYDGNDYVSFQRKLEIFLSSQNSDSSVHLINVGPFSGGNVARQHGIQHAASPYIALLDDDDIWLENHIEDYIPFITEHLDKLILCSCCAIIQGEGYKSESLPARLIGENESISDYLFKVNGITLDCGFIQSSLILFSKELAMRVPFNQELKYHQDIDWLLRVEQSDESISFYQSRAKTVVYNSTPLSVSKKITPKKSCSWAINTFSKKNKRCLGDFILTQSYHYAKQNGTIIDEAVLFVSSIRYGRPGWYALLRASLKFMRIDTIYSIVMRRKSKTERV
ncbi:glycosyltransferase family 2 protein [Raoultella planticola]|uniref:glycosyltransferase family 2 protein n=1 Tax=Raoultella planticola TaxID=575 RepID=UPI001151F0B7|nr:glycosyltransferase family A protein [Raoultella planticola]TQN55422.1 glycosyltransferase family 2 protein [Raoultella planticola]